MKDRLSDKLFSNLFLKKYSDHRFAVSKGAQNPKTDLIPWQLGKSYTKSKP